jgi:hypothetical protein
VATTSCASKTAGQAAAGKEGSGAVAGKRPRIRAFLGTEYNVHRNPRISRQRQAAGAGRLLFAIPFVAASAVAVFVALWSLSPGFALVSALGRAVLRFVLTISKGGIVVLAKLERDAKNGTFVCPHQDLANTVLVFIQFYYGFIYAKLTLQRGRVM